MEEIKKIEIQEEIMIKFCICRCESGASNRRPRPDRIKLNSPVKVKRDYSFLAQIQLQITIFISFRLCGVGHVVGHVTHDVGHNDDNIDNSFAAGRVTFTRIQQKISCGRKCSVCLLYR